jgi:hypothetical protein
METCQFDGSIWVFGCSCVWGDGIAIEQAMPSILEKTIGIHTINFGICGGNVFNIIQNLEYLLSKYSPIAVVIAYPSLTRWTDDNGHNWGSWNLLDNRNMTPYRELVVSNKLNDLSEIAVKTIREIIKNIPAVEFRYDNAEKDYGSNVLQDCYRIKTVDLATDTLHPGPATQKNAANWVAAQLKEKGVIP